MVKKDPRVDRYIEKSAPFAQPILKYIRKVVHTNCANVEETIKWQMPFFEYKGFLCHMAAFKEHCALGFWHPRMRKHLKITATGDEAMGHFGRISRVADLPAEKKFGRFIRQAMEFNETQGDAPVRPRGKPKPEPAVPEDLAAALRKNGKAAATFAKFPPSHRREYIEWITEAKRLETRETRLATTLEWLVEGKSRHWKYQKR
jgi:uncharacterized protein YdeI (YjbR/CyaY-like superfamily)